MYSKQRARCAHDVASGAAASGAASGAAASSLAGSPPTTSVERAALRRAMRISRTKKSAPTSSDMAEQPAAPARMSAMLEPRLPALLQEAHRSTWK